MAQNQDLRMLLFRARLLLEEGQADKALPILEALQSDNEEEQQEIIYFLGWCYVSSKRWDDAARVLSPIPQFVEGDGGEESRIDRVRLVHSLLRLAQAAVNLGQFEDASRHYTKCLKVLQNKKIQLPEAKLKARYGLAMTYLMRGLHTVAIQHYELALGLCLYIDNDEEIGNIYYGLCQAYVGLGNLVNAQLAGEKALALYERSTNRHLEGLAHNMLGHIYLKLGDYRAASDHYTEALSLAASLNGHKMIMINCASLAEVRLAEGRVEEAKRFCQRALENINLIEKKDRYLESLTYLECGKVAQAEAQQVEGERRKRLLEEAIKWFERTQTGLSPLQAYNQVTELYGLWAEVLEQLGRYEEAITCWKSGYEALSAANGPELY